MLVVLAMGRLNLGESKSNVAEYVCVEAMSVNVLASVCRNDGGWIDCSLVTARFLGVVCVSRSRSCKL